ncbi:hypothetical protein ACGFNV_11525 [Streptomyces sp. NPDC048751]|uniref:hypothetical protein n=1 Tax=Streptomyces sp. NPDC048751 TaxID=3365591 RepID=UPI00370FBDC7
MQSEPAIESRADVRGRRRKRGNESADGPVFVDTSGRRSRLLRRIGLLLGVACLGYAAVLGAAFMGWGTSLTPSSLLPFGGRGPGGQGAPEGQSGQGPGGFRPDGGQGEQAGRPSGIPSAPPSGASSGAPTTSPSASASAAAN